MSDNHSSISEVLSFLHPLDLVFSVGLVSKSCHRSISNLVKNCGLNSFHEFFTTRRGRSCVRTWIRLAMFEIAREVQNQVSSDNLDATNVRGLKKDLKMIVFYLSHFNDLRQISIVPCCNTPSSGGSSGLYFLEFLFNAIASIVNYFQGNKGNDTITTPTPQSNPQEPARVAPSPEPIVRLIKCVVDGQSGVGKTSFTKCLMKDKIVIPGASTPIVINPDYMQRKYVVHQEDPLKIQLWDTYGQERFRALNSGYYRGASIVFLMFDVTDRKSFLELDQQFCMKFLLEYNYEIVLIGNKTDLVEGGRKQREVTKEEALEFAKNVLDGALYVESTNTNLKVPSILGWYVAINQVAMKKAKPPPVVREATFQEQPKNY